MKRLSFSTSILATSIAQILLIGFSALTSILIGRIMGVSARGQWALITTTLGIIGVVLEFGLGYAVNYYIGQSKGLVIKGNVIRSALVSQTAIGIIAIFPVLLLTTRLESLYRGISPIILTVMAFSVPLLITQSMLLTGLQALLRMLAFNILRLILPVSLSLLLLFVYFVKQPATLELLLVTWIIAVLASILIGGLILGKSVPWDRYADWNLIKKLYLFGGKAYFGNVTKMLTYRVDIFIVGWFLDPRAVGIYAVAVSFAELLFVIPNIVSTVLLPYVASTSTNGNVEYTPVLSRITLVIATIGGFVLWVMSWIFVRILYGADFLDAVVPLKLLIPGVVFLSLWKVLVTGLAAKGYPEIVSFSSFVSLIVMVMFDILLIPLFKVPGASIASTFGYIAALLVTCFWMTRQFGISSLYNLIPKFSDRLIMSKFVLNIWQKRKLLSINHFIF